MFTPIFEAVVSMIDKENLWLLLTQPEFKNYYILNKCGEGANGNVYKTKDK